MSLITVLRQDVELRHLVQNVLTLSYKIYVFPLPNVL
jgi:hypothetical protein